MRVCLADETTALPLNSKALELIKGKNPDSFLFNSLRKAMEYTNFHQNKYTREIPMTIIERNETNLH